MIVTTPWNHFVWQTASFSTPLILNPPFSVRRARLEEKEKATQVALLSLKMNTEWHDATDVASACIKEAAEAAFFEGSEPSCLVIAHGQRIIGVSILNLHSDAPYHLATGPWVLMEYRNRGLGSALLHASVQELAQHGLTEARGMTRANSITARFVYSKFGGIMSAVAAPALVSEIIKKK